MGLWSRLCWHCPKHAQHSTVSGILKPTWPMHKAKLPIDVVLSCTNFTPDGNSYASNILTLVGSRICIDETDHFAS